MIDVVLCLSAGAVLALAGIAIWTRNMTFPAQSPRDYAGLEPAFDVRKALSGPILCEGVLYGPTGRVVSRFVADMEGEWTGTTGVLREHFRYDSGAVQDRQWTLTLGNDGSIRAEAPDLVGQGTGVQSGASVRLNYRIRLPESSGGHVLDVTDWMYLVDNGTIINRSQFRKFGFKVAELVATMRPREAA